MHQHQSNNLCSTRFNTLNGRFPHKPKDLGRNNICRPFFRLCLCCTHVWSHAGWEILTKSYFERHANEGGVTINSYHADNRQFADSGFQQVVEDCNQKITYCAVAAHHQKWDGWKKNQRTYFDFSDITSSCQASLVRLHYYNDVAICTQRGSISAKLTLASIRWLELWGNFLWCQ